jgi:glycosyltransferase involved in cell wall biosynthesis
MWPLTGGCHYDDECRRFQDECGNCPILNSSSERDLSYRILKRKTESWANIPMVVVATSHWLADMARTSAVFKNKQIVVIPNGIDTDKYKPINKSVARETWRLPQDKNLILFSAFSATSDKRKGNQYLIPALESMAKLGWGENTELVVVGASEPAKPIDFGMPVHYVGNLGDEISQVLLYSAVDVTVAPSMQENLSNTVMESLSCGTPVVAFDIGGMPDLIEHMKTGYLARSFEVNDLHAGIKWVLENKERHEELSVKARQSVIDKYTLENVAMQYAELYKEALR